MHRYFSPTPGDKSSQSTFEPPCSVASMTSERAFEAFSVWCSAIAQPGEHSSLISIESNSHPTAGGQGFGLLPLSTAVVWTWACFCAPASHCHQLPLVFASLCSSSSRRGWDWLFLPSRVILGHKQHLLSLQFLLTEQLPLSCVMKQMYLSELMKAWNVLCIG